MPFGRSPQPGALPSQALVGTVLGPLKGDTPMRKVVLYQLLSLDGVAEEPGDWFFDTDRAIFENLVDDRRDAAE